MSQQQHDLLTAAQSLADRGWFIIPMKIIPIGDKNEKKPTCKYADMATPLKGPTLARQIIRSGVNGIAVIPKRSGIAARDYDKTQAYEEFRDSYPELASSLPTVKTPRGYQVYCQSDRPETKMFTDGEWRGGDTLCVLPPSLGNGYQWLNPLPSHDLPFVPSKLFFPEDHQGNVSESSDAISLSESSESSDYSKHSDHSETIPSGSSDNNISLNPLISPSDIIRATQPTRPGERNSRLFDLARGLKFNAGITTIAAAKPFVDQWWKIAVEIVATKSFSETWSDFIHAFESARRPLGWKLLDEAAAQANSNPLPEIAGRYDDEPVQQLISICASLAKLNEGKFYFSSHEAGKMLRITQMQAWRHLRMLEVDGVIQLVERGIPGKNGKATRYRWIGGA